MHELSNYQKNQLLKVPVVERITEKFVIYQSDFKVKAVDTTAAGDTFCGALAVALVEDKSLKEALQFASAAAAISVTRMGAQPSAPTRKEIDKFLKENE